jgi:hypothetical protein
VRFAAIRSFVGTGLLCAGCGASDASKPLPPDVPAAPLAPVLAAPPPCPAAERWLPAVAQGPADPALVAIDDAHHLAPFLAKVAALVRGRAADHLRVAVYGDSNLTMDQMTGQMRRTLQGRYGDAGHGFVALGRPWAHYHHMDVEHDCEGGFDS